MARFRAKVVGAEGVIAGLRAASPAVQDKIRPITKRAVEDTRADAKRAAPRSPQKKSKGTRHLADTGKTKVAKDGLSGSVTFGSKGARHAMLVELGTKPHTIKVPGKYRKGKPARVLTNGREFFGKEVKHPGAKAKPFLEPALKKNAPAWVAGVQKAINDATR